jgi:hypothetical protein
LLAFLQAIFPEQSQSSRYRLMVMDRDGSNLRIVFPPEGSQGLEPQRVVWTPQPEEGALDVSMVYQGNLWILNIENGQALQITGDASIARMDWQ